MSTQRYVPLDSIYLRITFSIGMPMDLFEFIGSRRKIHILLPAGSLGVVDLGGEVVVEGKGEF